MPNFNAIKSLKYLIVIFSVLAFIPAYSAEEGQRAPEFQAKLFSGEKFSLAANLGQVVILHFWASWCESCQVEMPILDNYYQQHRAEGLKIVAVSMDSPKDETKARDVMKKYSFSGATLAKDASFKSYGRIWRIPLTFVIDRKGVLRKDGWPLDKPMAITDLEHVVTPLLKAKP